MFKLQMRTMDLFLLLGLILTGAPRAADGHESMTVTVRVREGHEAILPCSVSTNMESESFVWKNKDKKEVFFYAKKGQTGDESIHQLKDFKGRVFHFKDELKNGNASIRIINTKMADRGAYSCCFRFQGECCLVQLEVGVCPEPHLTHLMSTNTWTLLQCKVSGVSSLLQLKIKNSSGTALSDQPKKESKGEGTYDIVLQTNVTKTGTYTCVATQEDICHQISSTTYVYVPGPAAKQGTGTSGVVAGLIGAAVGAVLVLFVVGACWLRRHNQGSI